MRTLDGTETHRPRRLFAVASGLSLILLIALGFGMTFFSDEWAFIESTSLVDPSTWLAPHNEHWSTLPIIAYRLLVETVGIGSYVPYLFVVALLHLAVAGLVFRLLERSSGPWAALAGGVIVLLFGSGFENLYWGFQIGFVGSTALGLAALVVMDGGVSVRRACLVALLLLASLATSGIGIVMSVAVGLEWLLDRRWRRFLPILGLPATLYAAWYVTYGRTGITTQRNPFTLEALLDVPGFVVAGLGNALQSVTGLPWQAALGLGVLAVAFGARQTMQRAIDPRAVSLLGAIVVQYALTGAVRAQLFEGIVAYTRYTYVTGILSLIAIGTLLGTVRLPSSPRPRLLGLAAIASWLTITLVLNVRLLAEGAGLFLDRADMTRALVTVALDDDRPPDAQLERSLVLVPSARSLERIVEAYGDPRTDSLVPWAVRPIPTETLAEARRRLIEGAPIPGVRD